MILTGKDKYQTGRYIMNDLKKVEEHFHEFLKAALREKPSRIDAIKLTEELFEQEEAFLMKTDTMSMMRLTDVIPRQAGDTGSIQKTSKDSRK